MKKLTSILSISVLVCGMTAFAQTAGSDMKQAGGDVKDATKATGRATKKGAKKVGHGVKKGAHATASGTEKGAEKMKEKTQ